jgi:hypothetical protein
MAKKLKVGDRIHGYRITKVFGPGMMAISYAAQAPSGTKVFFKQYKSPAPTVVWYDAFVAYQKEPRTSPSARSTRSRTRGAVPATSRRTSSSTTARTSSRCWTRSASSIG